MKSTTILTTLLGLGLAVGTASAKELEKFRKSEPLKDVTKADVTIELGLADFTLTAGDPETLVLFEGRYDPDYVEPELDVDRSGHSATVQIEAKPRRHTKHADDVEGTEYTVKLSPKPDIDLSCEVGLGDNTIDLSDLRIERLSIEAGLSESDVTVDKPNPLRASRVSVETGLGKLKTDHLGNLRFDDLKVEGGLGDVNLDLRGYEGEGTVKLDVGLGSCDLILPKDLGVEILYEKSFLSSVDLKGFVNVGSDRYQTQGYDKAKNKLEINLSVGMGSVNIEWED